MLLLVGILGLGMLAAVLVTSRVGEGLVERNLPLRDAAASIKHELGIFHLAMERELFSHEAVHPSSASWPRDYWKHLDRAEWLAQAMLDGGKDKQHTYVPLETPETRSEVLGMLTGLKTIRQLAKQSVERAAADEAGIRRELRFDETLAGVLLQANEVEAALNRTLTSQIEEYRLLTRFLLVSCAVFTLAVSAVLYRHARRRALYVDALSESSRLAALGAETGLALTKGGSMNSALQGCAEAMVKHLNAAFARIWTYDEAGGELVLKCSAGAYTDTDGAFSRVKLGSGKIGRIALEKKPHLTNSVIGDPEVLDQAWARREGMTSFAGYPLVVNERLVGVVAMFSRYTFSGTTLDIIRSVADEIAIGIVRYQSEDDMKKIARQQKAILDNIPDIAWLKDKYGKFIAVNEAFGEAGGLDPAEVAGKNDFDFWPRELAERYQSDDSEVTRSGRRKSVEEPLVDKDGRESWLHTIKTPIFNDSGEVVGTTGIARDITERKNLERQRADFFAMITHDIKSPLTAISGYADLIVANFSGNVDEDTREMGESIKASSKKLLALVEDFLAFSQIESGSLRLRPSPVDVSSLMADVYAEFSPIAKKRGVGLTLETVDLSARPILDRKQTERALSNLVQNAVNYTSPGGRITMSSGEVGDGDRSFVAISVKDTGAGIPLDMQKKVFEKYYRLPGSEHTKGTGLGLAIVKAITEAHGGRVELASEERKGSEFRLLFPFTPPSRK